MTTKKNIIGEFDQVEPHYGTPFKEIDLPDEIVKVESEGESASVRVIVRV